MSNFNKTVKSRLVLKVEMCEPYMVNITLIYIDKKFLAKENETLIYSCKKNNFYIYSRNSFFLSINSIRFPNSEHYKSTNKYTRRFFNDKERYDYLKNLSISLSEWGNNYLEFKKDEEYDLRRKKVKFDGKYWIL